MSIKALAKGLLVGNAVLAAANIALYVFLPGGSLSLMLFAVAFGLVGCVASASLIWRRA